MNQLVIVGRIAEFLVMGGQGQSDMMIVIPSAGTAFNFIAEDNIRSRKPLYIYHCFLCSLFLIGKHCAE